MKESVFSRQWIKECLFLLLFATVIVALELPRCLWGFDMEDEGWVLSAAQNIFSDPSSVSYNFLYYNGVLVDGIWNLWFGQYGLISFRILYIIAEIAKALLVYFILRKYCNRYAILIGYAVSLLFVFNRAFFFYHNELTSLLCLLAMFFIIRALEKKEWRYMLAGGVVVGINIFTRIPNVALCGLILVLILYWANTGDHKTTLNLFFASIGGFFLGCLIEIALMYSLGHLSIFIDNITSGFSASGDLDSTHNLMSMGKDYLEQLHTIWLNVASIGFLSCMFWYAKRRTKQLNRNIYFATIALLILFTLTLICYQFRTSIENRLFALVTLVCLYIIYRAPSELKYISTLALLYMYLLPLGSDWGYTSGIIYQTFRLSLTLSIACILTNVIRADFKKYIVMLPICLYMVFILGYSVCHSAKYYIRDCKMLFQEGKNYPIHSHLATVYNDCADYAAILNPLLDELSLYVKPGDMMLCYQSPAMVHYLTETRPYLGNAWPWTYTSADMERRFIKAQADSDQLPVIVREKGWILDPYNWENYADWDNANAMENRFHKNKKIQLIQDFIKNHDYKLVWENRAFQILIPPAIYSNCNK